MHTLRQFLMITAVLALASFGAWRLWRGLASDDQQARWRLAEMASGFNEGDVGPVLGGLAEEFFDESSGASRADVRGILAHLFFTEIDSTTKRFRLRVELPVDELELPEPTPTGEGGRARIELDLAPRFFKTVHGAEEPFWDAHMHVEMEDTDDGWQIVRTSKVNHYDRGSLR